jgi:hypothetical protein
MFEYKPENEISILHLLACAIRETRKNIKNDLEKSQNSELQKELKEMYSGMLKYHRAELKYFNSLYEKYKTEDHQNILIKNFIK